MIETKAKITFVLPDNLQRDFREQVIKDGYDMRGKSRWISESIEFLLRMRNCPELVHLNGEMKLLKKAESVVVTKDIRKLIDDAVINIRLIYPTIEGVQSRIIRTAILQRLLRS